MRKFKINVNNKNEKCKYQIVNSNYNMHFARPTQTLFRYYSNFKPTVLNPTGNVLLETDKEKIESGELLYYKNAITKKTTFDLYRVDGEFDANGEKILIGKFEDQFDAVMCMEKQPKKEGITQRFWIERNNNDNNNNEEEKN